MPRPHTTMRKIRDVLRLTFDQGLSLREVASSLSMPYSTVGVYLRRAKVAGLSWPLPDDLFDDELEARLFPSEVKVVATKPEPDFAVVHKELRKKGVQLTLLWFEYREIHPWRFRQFWYSHFVCFGTAKTAFWYTTVLR
jgi:hypothetical protein